MYRKKPKGWLKHWDFILLEIICLITYLLLNEEKKAWYTFEGNGLIDFFQRQSISTKWEAFPWVPDDDFPSFLCTLFSKLLCGLLLVILRFLFISIIFNLYLSLSFFFFWLCFALSLSCFKSSLSFLLLIEILTNGKECNY